MPDTWELIRLSQGTRIPDALVELARDRGWHSAVCNAIGGVSDVELAYYDLATKKYLSIAVEGIVELVSLQGNMTGPAREPFWHLHAIVADRTGRCFAGHLNHCSVALTVEFTVWPSSLIRLREFNEPLGLKLLQA